MPVPPDSNNAFLIIMQKKKVSKVNRHFYTTLYRVWLVSKTFIWVWHKLSYLLPTYLSTNEISHPVFTVQLQRTAEFWPIFISHPTENRRLSWPGLLVTHRCGLPTQRWSTIIVLTELKWCAQCNYDKSPPRIVIHKPQLNTIITVSINIHRQSLQD